MLARRFRLLTSLIAPLLSLWWIASPPAIAESDALHQLRDALGPVGARVDFAAEVIERRTLRNEVEQQSILLRLASGETIEATAWVPPARPGRRPAVLCAGLEEAVYRGGGFIQTAMASLPLPPQELAQRGFLALAWHEPPWSDDDTAALLPRGETTMAAAVRRGAVALEYVLSRGDIDQAAVGCLAIGARGMPAAYLAMLDERIRAFVSAGAVGGFEAFLRSVHEWPLACVPPGLWRQQMGHQYLALLAPRPALLITGPGHTHAWPDDVAPLAELAAFAYAQAGATDALRVEPNRIAEIFPLESRKAAYLAFERALLHEPTPAPESPRAVWDALASEPPAPAVLDRAMLDRLLGPAHRAAPAYKIGRLGAPAPDDGIARVALATMSPRGHLMQAVLLRRQTLHGPLPVAICLHRWEPPYTLGKLEPAGLQGDASRAIGLELARHGYLVLCPDLVGHGDYISSLIARAYDRDPEQRLRWPAAVELAGGSTLLRWIVDDLRHWADFLLRHPAADASQLTAIGDETGALCALAFAALDPRVTTTVCVNGPAGYETLRMQGWRAPLAAWVPALERHGDWEAVARLIAPRRLIVVAAQAQTVWPLEGTRALAAAAGAHYKEAPSPDHAVAAALDALVDGRR